MSKSSDPRLPGSDDSEYIELSEQRGLEMVAIDPPTEGYIISMADPNPELDNFED